jgi:hypothetical protein
MASPPPPSAAAKTEKIEEPKLYKKPAFWATIGGLLALLMLGTTLVGSLSEWREQKAVLAPTVPKPVAQEKEVVAVGWVDQGVVVEGKPFRLWVSLENRSGSPALGLRYRSFQIPGFHPGNLKVGGRLLGCWKDGPACRPQGPGLPPILGLPDRLEKGQSVSVFAVLVPSTHRQFGASGVFTWRDDQGKEHEGAVVVPPVPAVAQGEQLWSSLGKMVLLLKDLLLPAALAYLGWYLKRRDDDQKKLQDQAKSDREAKERAEEKKRLAEAEKQASLQETWRLMLPKSHANAEQHYMPVVASIELLQVRFGNLAKNGTVENRHQFLFELLRLLRRMQHLGRQIGGFYFKDREGERLAKECWDPFFERSRTALGPEDRERALAHIEPNENLASFLDKLSGKAKLPQGGSIPSPPGQESIQSVLTRIDTKLQDWIRAGGFQRNLPLLELFRTVLTYEMNRPYEFWYGERMNLEEEKLQIALLGLETEPEEFQRCAEAYLARERPKPSSNSAGPQP